MMDERNAEHTPEPWAQDIDYVTAKVVGGRPGGEVIICCRPSVYGILGHKTRAANAQRIVACVNALAGIADPQAFVTRAVEAEESRDRLESLISREMFTAAGECVEACKRRVSATRNPHVDPFSWEVGWDDALSMICAAFTPTAKEPAND